MTDRLHLINKLSGKEANELKLRMIDGEFINEEIIENLKYWLSLSNIDAELECLYGSALPHQECKGHCQAGSDPHLCLPFFPGLLL